MNRVGIIVIFVIFLITFQHRLMWCCQTLCCCFAVEIHVGAIHRLRMKCLNSTSIVNVMQFILMASARLRLYRYVRQRRWCPAHHVERKNSRKLRPTLSRRRCETDEMRPDTVLKLGSSRRRNFSSSSHLAWSQFCWLRQNIGRIRANVNSTSFHFRYHQAKSNRVKIPVGV